jgi:hypothetical protein
MRLPMASNTKTGCSCQTLAASVLLSNCYFLLPNLPTLIFHTITHDSSHLHLYLAATSRPHYLNTSQLSHSFESSSFLSCYLLPYI